MEVVENAGTHITLRIPIKEAATLAGRKEFGNLPRLQAELRKQITDSWYAADCPRWKA